MVSKSVKSQLEEKTVLQLKKLASKKDIQGRSSMKKSQLVKALMKGGMKGGNRRLNQTELTLTELQSIINAKSIERDNKRSAGEELTHNDYMYYVRYERDMRTNSLIPRTSVLLSVRPFTSFSTNRFEISHYSESRMDIYSNIAELNELILSDDGSTIIHIYNEERNLRDFDEIINSTENSRSKNARETHAINIMKHINKKKDERREMFMKTGDPKYLPGAEIEAFFERAGRKKNSKSKTHNKPRKGNSKHNFRRNFNNHEPIYKNNYGNEYENHNYLDIGPNNWWYPPNEEEEEEEEENYEDYFAGNGAGSSSGNRQRNVNINELYNNEDFQTFLRTNPQNKRTYRQLYFGLSRKYHPNTQIKNGATASKETMNALKAKKTKQFQEIGRVKAEKEKLKM